MQSLIDPNRINNDFAAFSPGQAPLSKATGLIGTLSSVFGGPAGPAAFGLLGAGLNLLGGDGGQGQRLRTAQDRIGALGATRFDPSRFQLERRQFTQSLQPFLDRTLQRFSKQAGIGSGLVQAQVAEQTAAPLAQFSTQALRDQFANIDQNKRLAAQLSTQIV